MSVGDNHIHVRRVS